MKQLITRNDETKFVQTAVPSLASGGTALTNFVAFSSGITSTSEIYPAIPVLGQGVDSYERIGDSISPKSMFVNLNIAVKNGPSDAFSSDKIVHVWLMTSKAVKDLANYTSIPIASMLDNGQGASVGWDGTTGAAMLPIQKKSFTVLKHWSKRMQSGFGHPFGSTGTNAGATDSIVSPVQSSYATLRLKVKCPKALKYNSASALYPNNYAPFFVVGWVRADSAGNSAPSFVNTYVQATTGMYFKDA